MCASIANRRIADMNQLICRAALGAALLAPFAAGAQEPPPPGMPHEGGAMGRHSDGEMPPPFLRGIELSKAQKDKLAAIMRAQAPKLREQHKAVADADEALHALARSATFDEGRAAALAQTFGQAIAKAALQQARLEQQVLALLSAEQRQQIERRPPEGPRRPPRPQ
jgi:periplasmic protein CpxP/Spy